MTPCAIILKKMIIYVHILVINKHLPCLLIGLEIPETLENDQKNTWNKMSIECMSKIKSFPSGGLDLVMVMPVLVSHSGRSNRASTLNVGIHASDKRAS